MTEIIQNKSEEQKPILNILRLISFNQKIPFCCVVNESTIAYIGGCSLIMENIRTLQQQIIWSGQNYHEIIAVAKNVINYGPVQIAFVLRNFYEKICQIVVFSIDWNNYFYQKRNEKYIKIPQIFKMPQNSLNILLQFQYSGQILYLHSVQRSMSFLTIFNIKLQKEPIKKQLLEPLQLIISFKQNNQSRLALVFKKIIQITNKFGQLKSQHQSIHSILSSECSQEIKQIQFGENHSNQVLGFVLTNLGNFIVFKFQEGAIEGIFKIDIRAYQKSMKLKCQNVHSQHGNKEKTFRTINFIDNKDLFDENYDNFIQLESEIQLQSDKIQNKSSINNEKDETFISKCQPRELLLPVSFTHHGNRIIFGYQNSRKLIHLTFSLINYTSYSIFSTDNQIFFPHQHIEEHFLANSSKSQPREKSKVQLKQKELTVQKISLSNDLCTGGLIVFSQGYVYIMVLDILNSLIPMERRVNSSSLMYGNINCKGSCKSVAFSQKQNALFILFENKRKQSHLAYFLLNFTILTRQPPNKILIWSNLLKSYAYKFYLHPINFSLLILYEEICRIHFYTRQSLSENAITLNIGNCQCGGYSPLGDKIILCNLGSVFIVDNYTYQVINIISSASGVMNKSPRNLQFINNFDVVIEYGSGNVSYLMQILEYKKVKILGQIVSHVSLTETNIINSYLEYFDQASTFINSSPEVYPNFRNFSIDQKREIIIYAHLGYQLRFYNFNMDLLNVLSIRPQSINLSLEMELLFVGSANGSLYIFQWPQIVDKVTNIKSMDPDLIAAHNVHNQKIVSIQISINLRYLVIVSQSGAISIMEFLQQNSPSISRRGALNMLKKSNIKAITQNCLTSLVEQNKRAEKIVKAVGKEVQINKRNQKVCQQLVKKLEEEIKEENFKTELLIKDQIDGSTEEKRIKNLVRRMQFMKNELSQMSVKKSTEKQKIKEQFEKKLNIIYKQKEKLQWKLQQMKRQTRDQKEKQLRDMEKQRLQEKYAEETQLKLIEEGTLTNKNINSKLQSFNKMQFYKIEETKIESMQMIRIQYNKQLAQLHQIRNNLQNSVKKTKIYITELKTKINTFILQTMEIERDLDKIKKVIPQRRKNEDDLKKSLQEVKKTNEELIFEHRALQLAKNNTEKKSDHTELLHNNLKRQIIKLNTMHEQMKSKKSQLDDLFYEENSKKVYLHQNIQNAEKKVTQLKEMRNFIKQEAILMGIKYQSMQNQHESTSSNIQDQQLHRAAQNLSNPKHEHKIQGKYHEDSNFNKTFSSFSNKKMFRSSQNSPQISKKSSQNQSLHQTHNFSMNKEYENFQQGLQKRNQTNEKIQKLNRIKNEKIKKYRVFNEKLINDHKRLISQLNQLKRYNDYLWRKEQKLKTSIKKESFTTGQSRFKSMHKSEKCEQNTQLNGFKKVNYSNIQKSGILRKGFASLHQDGTIVIRQ